MKKLLQLSILFLSSFCFGQVVSSHSAINVGPSSVTITFNSHTINNFYNVDFRYIAAPGNAVNSNATVINHPSNPFNIFQGNPDRVFNLTSLLPLTTYNYIIRTIGELGNTDYSGSFTTIAGVIPTLTAISSVATGIDSANILYTINGNNQSATSQVRYGLNSSNLNLTSVVNNTPFGSPQSIIQPLTGLSPNTQYFYSVRATNGTGSENSPIQSFTTNSPYLLYHFPFNGNRNTIINSGSFTSVSSPVFVSDGNGNTSGALQVNVENTDVSRTTNSHIANLPLLPQGSNSRSVAMKINFSDASLVHFVASWGNSLLNESYGFEKTPSTITSAIWGNNVNFTNPTAINTWIDYVITFNGGSGEAKYYINGVLTDTRTHSNNTLINTTGTNLAMGRSVSPTFGSGNFKLDDLKIYNYVITPSEVAILSSESFSQNNLTFNLYPNPANSILNIDLATELKSVEIYSLQGQKVFSSNNKQINISNLSSGIYMINVTAIDGGVATQKLVKN